MKTFAWKNIWATAEEVAGMRPTPTLSGKTEEVAGMRPTPTLSGKTEEVKTQTTQQTQLILSPVPKEFFSKENPEIGKSY